MVAEYLQDPSYNEDMRLKKAAKVQSLLLNHFTTCWKEEYLTSLREYSIRNLETTEVGDVVLVHNEGPRLDWRLAVVEELIVGGDGLIRTANIRTSMGRTNRPIVKLYPLEINSCSEVMSLQSSHLLSHTINPTSPDVVANCRPTRASARQANARFAEWADTLLAPRRMLGTEFEHAYTLYYYIGWGLGFFRLL